MLTISKEKEVGVKLVNYLYTFSDMYELDTNKNKLKTLCTSGVFNELTVDNEERTMRTYLKFRGEPSVVKVIKSRRNYVLYRLETEAISKDRLFILTYDLDKKGRVCYVREMECIDFIKYVD